MGADMYLNPPAPEPKDRVVVVQIRTDPDKVETLVYGDYTEGEAAYVKRQIVESDIENMVSALVRKKRRWARQPGT